MVLALVFLVLAIGCYSISQLQQHGKLKWMGKGFGFWGVRSWNRKYKWDTNGIVIRAPKNLYYKYFARVPFKERFPLSATLLVFTTDGYHLMQFFFFLFISLSSGMALQLNWWLIAVVWLLVHLVHFGAYRIFQK